MEHRDITGLNNHEPKGIENADSGEVYVADGAGSGVWQDLDIPTGAFVADIKKFTNAGTSDWTVPSDLFAIKVIVQAEGGGISTAATNDGDTSSFGTYLSATG